MRKSFRMLAVASMLGLSVVSVSSLYADSTGRKRGSMMGEGGMMSHMGQMRSMMEGCNRMMGMAGRGSERPNDQWRKRSPNTPDKKS